MVDYTKFRLSKLNTPEFSHLWYLLYWPVYGLVFMILERFVTLDYTYVHCALDDMIPFNEIFVIPYLVWFVYLVGMMVYTLLFDAKSFVYFMKLIIITCSAACIAYVVYPTAQALRPLEFERDNILTDIVKAFYSFDTNTNVCPSVHVSASIVVMLTAFKSKHFSTPKWKFAFFTVTVLICLSTVFMKQHSVIDGIWAIIVCIGAQVLINLADKLRIIREENIKAQG